MGLNFKFIVIWKALSTMPPKVVISAAGVTPGGFGSAGSRLVQGAAASAAAHSAPPSAASSAPHVAHPSARHVPAQSPAQSAAHTPRQRGNRGNGGGASLSEEQVAAQKAEAEAKAAEARARTLRAQVDAAESEARIRAAQSIAVVHSTPRARPGATSGGGDFVTRREFNEFSGQVDKGFLTIFQQNQQTHDVLSGFVKMMNGGQRQLPPPERCQSGNTPQEVIETQRQISYGQNAGWDKSVEGSSRFAAPSSQRQQSVAYGGGGVASDSSRFVIRKEASTEFHGSSGGSTLVAARQLGVGHHLPDFEANFSKLKSNDFNIFVCGAIRNFVASFPQEQQDEMACVLLGMVNGKKYSAHNSIIIQSNESVFRQFFGELARKFPKSAVKITNKRCQEMSIPFNTLSTDPSAMCVLIRVLRGEE